MNLETRLWIEDSAVSDRIGNGHDYVLCDGRGKYFWMDFDGGSYLCIKGNYSRDTRKVKGKVYSKYLDLDLVLDLLCRLGREDLDSSSLISSPSSFSPDLKQTSLMKH